MKVLVLLLGIASVLKAQSTQELVTMGDALDEQNRNSEALAIYLKADAAQPNDAEILWRISKQYDQLMLDTRSASEKAQLGGKALDAAKRAVAADPDNAQALRRWNYEIASFNPVLKALAQTIYGKLPDASMEKAVDWFQRVIALKPRRAIHHLELGRASLALGEAQKARQELNTGLAFPSIDKDDDDKNKGHASHSVS
jgi:tetratricopeptide (TPR) repeat protein